MLVWDLKYVSPATELVLKINLSVLRNHKLKRSPQMLPGFAKLLIVRPSSPAGIKPFVVCWAKAS